MGHETSGGKAMTRVSAAADILGRRAAFSAYNVSRIRELIRGLSPRKYRLFRQIPVWLHMNRPRTPGFIPDIRVPFGIYRFHETGFWKQALKDLKQSEKKLHPFLSPRQHIQGLYLMGSSGTLAQTDASDFDYWVVVREEEMSPAVRALLSQKLKRIETYCRQRYGQAVTFFVLDEGQVRANAFDVMDEESSGSAQKTLLKEEFYRTFIMVAGRIPYWAVLPPGLDDWQYRQRIDAALTGRHLRFLPEDYIDLGNLAALDRDESLGAILWQIYKSRHSPAKSLLKAALVAHYFFSEAGGFLCDTIKTRFFEGGAPGSLLDPYALVFERGLSFFEDLEDPEGLGLLEDCIFLRLGGHGPASRDAGETPREMLLGQYLRKWGWDREHAEHMSRYRHWPEAEKLRFERAVFDKISFLYELIQKGGDRAGAAVRMTDRDLMVLTNRISGYFRREAGKIPRCSSYAGKNASSIQFVVEGTLAENGSSAWSVFGSERQRSLRPDALFFKGPELLKTAGWLILNRLYTGRASGVGFQAEAHGDATGSQARRLVQGAYEFFGDPSEAHHLPPAWARIMICLHRSAEEKGAQLVRADFLSLNTWGEFYFDRLGLMHAGTAAQAGYHIAEHLWKFMKGAPSFRLPYRMVCPGGGVAADVEGAVSGCLDGFADNAMQLGSSGPQSGDGWGDSTDNPLLLDR